MRISDWSSDVCSSDLLAGGRQDPLAGFVMLADDARPAAAVEAEVEVVEQLLHLAFDEAVLLLDHEDVLEPARERADAHRLQRPGHADLVDADAQRSEEHTSELKSLMRISYDVFGLKKKNTQYS